MWTRFYDMHSGGDTKEDYQIILIEAKEELAKLIFYNRFGHNPDRVSCTCCGSDYWADEVETPDLDEIGRQKCLVIPKEEIKLEEMIGSIPNQGYVWVG